MGICGSSEAAQSRRNTNMSDIEKLRSDEEDEENFLDFNVTEGNLFTFVESYEDCIITTKIKITTERCCL